MNESSCVAFGVLLIVSFLGFAQTPSSQAPATRPDWSALFLAPPSQLSFDPSPQKYLTGVELFRRCYVMIIRRPLPDENQLLSRVKNGTLTGEEACVRLVGNATFNAEGILEHPDLDKVELARLLATFNRLHSSWFEAYNLSFSGENFGTAEFSDFQQMGYGLTRAFFGQRDVTSTLQGHEIFAPLRDPINRNQYLLARNPFTGNHLPWDRIGFFYDDGTRIQGRIPQAPRGTLRGFAVEKESFQLKKYFIQYEKFHENTDSNLRRHFGGGTLGSSTYLLLTMGDKVGTILDGQVRLPRRWAKSVFKDVMCRNLPVLDEADGHKYLQPESPNVFSKNESCMQCHATMDQIVGVIRDVQGGVNNGKGLDFDRTKNIQKDSKIGFSYLRSVHDSKKLQPADHPYAFAPQIGRLRMRDFNGQELDEPVASLDELGQKIAATDDFYMCQARRYFKFLTGIDVETDPIVLKSSALTQQDKLMVGQVHEWAMQLKKDQKAEKMVESMLRSPFFRHQNFDPIQPTSLAQPVAAAPAH